MRNEGEYRGGFTLTDLDGRADAHVEVKTDHGALILSFTAMGYSVRGSQDYYIPQERVADLLTALKDGEAHRSAWWAERRIEAGGPV